MGSGYERPGRLRWSLLLSGLGTSLGVGTGNSGGWQAANPNNPTQPNQESAIDLRDVEDGWITVSCGAIVAAPSLVVTLNRFDNTGQAWSVISVAAVTAAGIAGGKQVDFGKHGGSAGNFVVLPAWGQLSWTLTGAGASMSGVEIELWVR